MKKLKFLNIFGESTASNFQFLFTKSEKIKLYNSNPKLGLGCIIQRYHITVDLGYGIILHVVFMINNESFFGFGFGIWIISIDAVLPVVAALVACFSITACICCQLFSFSLLSPLFSSFLFIFFSIFPIFKTVLLILFNVINQSEIRDFDQSELSISDQSDFNIFLNLDKHFSQISKFFVCILVPFFIRATKYFIENLVDQSRIQSELVGNDDLLFFIAPRLFSNDFAIFSPTQIRHSRQPFLLKIVQSKSSRNLVSIQSESSLGY